MTTLIYSTNCNNVTSFFRDAAASRSGFNPIVLLGYICLLTKIDLVIINSSYLWRLVRNTSHADHSLFGTHHPTTSAAAAFMIRHRE